MGDEQKRENEPSQSQQERLARFLEREEARERRRAHRPQVALLVFMVLSILAIGAAMIVPPILEQRESDQRTCEMYQDMTGGDPDDC